MNTVATPPPLPIPPRAKPSFRWILVGVAGLIALLGGLLGGLAYPLGNWRGKRAWENCRRDLAARGEVLDWAAYVPAPVPDEQNRFKAPNLSQWFVGRGSNELSQRLNPENFQAFSRQRNPNSDPLVVAELTVSSGTNLDIGKLDAKLRRFRKDNFIFTQRHLATSNAVFLTSRASSNIIPLIIMDAVSLPEAVINLTRKGDLKYSVDPKINLAKPGQDNQPAPDVSVSWEDLTAEAALCDLLDHYGLQWIADPAAGVARIERKSPLATGYPSAQEQLEKLIRDGLGTSVKTKDFTLLAGSFDQIKPARIVMTFWASDGTPTPTEIQSFLSSNSIASLVPDGAHVQIEPAGTNSFRVVLHQPQIGTAADYLAWSDEFKPHFDLIRDALKRPLARMDGDYQLPHAIPIQNCTAILAVAQTLARRAQSYLLLGQPERAGQELSRLQDLERLLETKPTTLASTMTLAIITGLYADVVADGLRLGVWREPELRAIQNQLKEVNLLPWLAAALRAERASMFRMLEPSLQAAGVRITLEGNNTNLHQDATNADVSRHSLLPSGWYYQNLANIALTEQRGIDAVHTEKQLMIPREVNAWAREREHLSARFRPYTWIAGLMFAFADFSKTFQPLAHNQTLANEALIACALERYRLEHGRYPRSLDALVPQFLEALPHDLINGQPLKYELKADGRFALYSIGWNELDDGGTVAADRQQGDWVWLDSRSN
jgi:hypothetical protein